MAKLGPKKFTLILLAFLVYPWTLVSQPGCTEETAAEVYVPGDRFEQRVIASSEALETTVGEWVTLHARRATGPWQRVQAASLGPDACWLQQPPPPVEREVSNNVTWIVEPTGSAEFDLPKIPQLQPRRVRFARPGTYRLTARSAGWCREPFESNIVTVVVHPTRG